MGRRKRWILSAAGTVILLLILAFASLSGCGAASVLLIGSQWQDPFDVRILNNERTVWQGKFDEPAVRAVHLTGLMGGSLDVKATLSDGTVLSAELYLVPDNAAVNVGASTMFVIGQTEIVYSPWRYWMALNIEPNTFLGKLMSIIDMFPHGASCLVRRPLDTLGW